MLYWIEDKQNHRVDVHYIADVFGIHDVRRKKARFVDYPGRLQELTHPNIRYSYGAGKRTHHVIRSTLKVKDDRGTRDIPVDIVARVLKRQKIWDYGTLSAKVG